MTAGQFAKNSDGIHEVTINKTPLEAHDRLNTPDPGGNGKLKPAEAATAAQLIFMDYLKILPGSQQAKIILMRP